MDKSEDLQLSKYVENSNNIYDLYIQLYSYLRKHQSTVFRTYEENKEIFHEFLNHTESVLMNSNFKILMCENNKKEILKMASNNQENLLLFVFALFSSIDEVFGAKKYRWSKNEYDFFERVTKTECMNTEKTHNFGRVFYKNSSLLEELYNEDDFIRDNNGIEDTIEKYQKNILVYEDPKTDYKIYLSEINCPYINDKLSKKNHSLSIALVPLTGDNKYVEFVNDGEYVLVKSLNDEEKYKEKIIDILNELKSKNIDIVIFPEMVFSESILMSVRKFLNKNKNYFTLIISGTIWRDRKNQCAVISGDGTELTRQLKLNRYHKTIYFNNYGNNEGIYVTSANKYINIMDIKGIGRFATPICADFISDGYFDELQKMGVNLSLIPAYTPSLSAFKTKASQLGTANKGSSFVCNCCIPIVNGKDGNRKNEKCDVSFVFVPLNNSKQNGEGIMKSCIPSECNCDCNSKKNCYLVASISESACVFEHFTV